MVVEMLDLYMEINRLKNELDAACRHVEALCKERTLYRAVADRTMEFANSVTTVNRKELRALRDVAEAARYGGFHHHACVFLEGKECWCPNQYLSKALKKLDEARRE